MEPQITQRAAVPYRASTMRLISRRGWPKLSSSTEMQARGFQIIQALRAMNLVDRLGYLQFDEDDLFDE